MNLFDMSKDQRRQWIARMLGCDPEAPNTWPDAVDAILHKAERAASDVVSEECARIISYRLPVGKRQ